jgi:putative ABC transport system substrate-binding protein
MRRRAFLLGGVAAAAAARTAEAQRAPRTARLGWLTTGDTFPRHYFDEEMARLGWVEGRNLTVERRVTGPDPARRNAMIAELIAVQPDLIVAGGTTDLVPLRAATATIPIVVVTGSDLVESGFVETLARPGGNVTGLTVLGRELDAKRLELVRELLPAATRVSMLGIATLPTYPPRVAAAATTAHALGLAVSGRMLTQPADLEGAFAAAAAEGDHAMLVPYNALTFENRPLVIAMAARFRLPAVYELREYAAEGGLLSYGAVYREYFERAASLADKILKGTSPAVLPVERPTKFTLVVNLRAARELGLPIPPALLARADEVIE